MGIAYLRSIGHTNNRKLATYCIGLDRSDDAITALGIETKEKRQKWQERILKEFKVEINDLPSSIKTLVISSEHFHSRLVNKNEIETLQNVVKTIADDIKIVMYLRPQVEMAISLYSTALKVGQYNSKILPAVDPLNSIYYNYDKLLTLWSQVFDQDNIIVRLFERKQMLKGDVIEDFMSNILGIDYLPEEFVAINKKNESITPNGQMLLNSINKHFSKQDDTRIKLRKYIENNYAGKGAYPSKDEYLAFQNKFVDCNRKVARQWFGKEKLFEIDYSNLKASKFTSYSEKEVDDLIGYFKTLL